MRQQNKGFSLVELMITVAIIGILAAIAVPSYQRYVQRARTVDLFNAIQLGQTMVAEYIQSTLSTDCTGMTGTLISGFPAISIPIQSPNILLAGIFQANLTPFTSCSVVVQGNPSVFTVGYESLAGTDGIPSVDLISNTIPYVQLTASSLPTALISVPTISDGRVTWTTYSSGTSAFSSSIPVFPAFEGYDGGGDSGGGGDDGGGKK